MRTDTTPAGRVIAYDALRDTMQKRGHSVHKSAQLAGVSASSVYAILDGGAVYDRIRRRVVRYVRGRWTRETFDDPVAQLREDVALAMAMANFTQKQLAKEVCISSGAAFEFINGKDDFGPYFRAKLRRWADETIEAHRDPPKAAYPLIVAGIRYAHTPVETGDCGTCKHRIGCRDWMAQDKRNAAFCESPLPEEVRLVG